MSSAEALPHWNLDSLYPGLDSEPYQQAVQELISYINDLDEFFSTHGVPQSNSDFDLATRVVKGYLESIRAIMRVNTTLRLYVWCIVDTDSANELAQRKLSELDMLNVRVKQLTTQFQSWLGENSAALPEIIAKNEIARAHALYLQESAEQSRYLMSEKEETLAEELAQTGINAWSKLHDTIWSQLEVPFEQDGRLEPTPMSVIQNLALFDPDPNIRQRAGEAEVAAWATMREPLTAALNGVMGTKIMLVKRRGRRDVLHAALDQARISRLILDIMLDSVRDVLPSFQSYLKTKATALGKKPLAWWDIYAPMGQTNRRFTFQEAQDFITSQFNMFNPRMGAFARRFFTDQWIDAEPRSGKQGGAYCNCAPGTGIFRILCNFDGSLQQVFTIAHELGHAFHFHCQTSKTYHQCQTPMTLAESASLFCETLITDQALANVSSPQEELAILNTFLGTTIMNVVGTQSSFLFEQEVYSRRERAELSADELCDLSRRFDLEVFGEALDPEHVHPYYWASIPHSFLPNISFYNFPYSFGLLFSLGLYAQYQQRGSAFAPEFESLLAITGEFMPSKLAEQFGIRLDEAGFWRASLEVIERRIRRFQELCVNL